MSLECVMVRRSNSGSPDRVWTVTCGDGRLIATGGASEGSYGPVVLEGAAEILRFVEDVWAAWMLAMDSEPEEAK